MKPIYLPDQYEHDAARIVGRYWEKWPRSFLSFARAERYPPRMWRTFAGLLLLGKGRPRFRCQLAEIAAASGQCRRTVITAVRELEIDGWLEVQRYRYVGSHLNARNRYTMPHLVPH